MRWTRVGAAVLIALAAAVAAFATLKPVTVVPRAGAAPPFELIDATGAAFRAPQDQGRITVYTFGALRDRERMQETAQFLIDAKDALAGAGLHRDVDFVFISIDPEHDAPPALRRAEEELSSQWGSSFPNLTFLTGSWLAVRMTVGTGFGVYYDPTQSTPAYEPVAVVVDPDHIMRARYSLADVNMSTFLRDVGLIAKEAGASGASRWLYEGAHLFLCYPR